MLQVLQRVLNARQFGLKLIANVTYGYAAAGFSGRMPMAELADAIVQVMQVFPCFRPIQLDTHRPTTVWLSSSLNLQSCHPCAHIWLKRRNFTPIFSIIT